MRLLILVVFLGAFIFAIFGVPLIELAESLASYFKRRS